MLARRAAKPRQQNSRRGDLEKRCEPFLKWIRGRACALADRAGHVCRGKVRACHVDYAEPKALSRKVSDQWAIPMCDGGHAEQTDILGWGPFEAKWKLDAKALASELWHGWLHGTAMGAKWRLSHVS